MVGNHYETPRKTLLADSNVNSRSQPNCLQEQSFFQDTCNHFYVGTKEQF